MNEDITHAQKTSLISSKTLGICLTVVTVAFLAVVLFKIPLSTVGFAGILLVCPLLHVWMMKDGGHKH